jgi:hypothetical protein
MSTKISDNIYAVGKNRVAMVFNAVKGAPRHSQVKVTKSNGDSEVCNWGDDNLYPVNFENKFNKIGIAVGGLKVLTTAHFGTGFSLYKETAEGVADDYMAVPFSKYPEIYQFFRKVKIDLFYKDVIYDYEKWSWAPVEYLLSPDYSKIISIKRHDTSWCRFQVPNETTGIIENVIVNSDWQDRKKENDVVIPVFSQMLSVEEIKEYVKTKKITRFVIAHMDTTSISKVYPVKDWHSSFKNGWMDVVLSIPVFKKFMFENQLNFKYLIHIADDYFAHRYGQNVWQEFSPAEQEQKREELVNSIDNKLSGNESAGRSLISPFFRDKNSSSDAPIKGVQIETIKQDQANGDFLLDASAGNSEIGYPMGVDSCLLGAGIPGGKTQSGSGSDRREAYTILCARLPAQHAVTLEIFLTIRDWNGWPQELIGKFPNVQLTTLDKNPTGQTSVVN